MSDDIKCPYCGSSDYVLGEFSGDPLICNSCGKPFIYTTNEKAHGCGYRDIPIRETAGGGMICKRIYEPVRPLPCIRDERGHIDMQEVKSLILKIHEELIELEEAIVGYTGASINFNGYAGNEARAISDADRERIAEEAADLKTAVTTLENALYIQESMRDEAQRRVNEKNRERGRL